MTLVKTIATRFAEIIQVPINAIDLDKDIYDVYNLDSVQALKLISDIEVEYDIDIDEDEARQIKTLNDVITLINTKTGLPQ